MMGRFAHQLLSYTVRAWAAPLVLFLLIAPVAFGNERDDETAHFWGGLKCGISHNDALSFGTLTAGDGWVRIDPTNGNNFDLSWSGVEVLSRDQSMVTCTFRRGADMSDLHVPDAIVLTNGSAEMWVTLIVESRSQRGRQSERRGECDDDFRAHDDWDGERVELSSSKGGGRCGSPATFDIGGELHVTRNQTPGRYSGVILLTLKHE